MGLSVAIITYNEEENIAKTLGAVKDIANEIVIVDSYSSDNTVKVAKGFGAKIIMQKFLGYGNQKNLAIDNCKNRWILLIDADEVITDKLAKEIKKIVKDSCEYVYSVKRVSVCFGKKLRYGGWSSNSVVRLFVKGSVRCSDDIVHEKYITDKKIKKLSSYLEHHTYNSISDYVSRFNKYTTQGAIELYNKQKKSSIIKIFLSPIYKFIRMYIFRLGLLDGYYGLVIALFSASYTMVKYMKLKELYEKKRNE